MNLLVVLFAVITCIHAEFFTSMANMEHLVLTEKYMLSSLKNYVESEEERLASLKKFMLHVDESLRYVNETDIGKYLGNPVNSYLLLKRFNVDWRNLENLLTLDHAEDFTAAYDEMRPYFPSDEDYEGAMTALFRLQDTYNLPSQKLAKGIIPGVVQSSPQALDPNEIFELGRHAYNLNDWTHSRDWMRTALAEIRGDSSVSADQTATVLDYLAYSEFKSGNVKEAFQLTQELAKLNPGEKRIFHNLEYYRQELRKSQSTGKRGDLGLLDDTDFYIKNKHAQAYTESEASRKKTNLQDYEKLCRGEVRRQSKREQSKMKCWYKTNNPLLKYKPQKVERVWFIPEIFLFHDILTEREMELMKQNAYPKLSRATIQDPVTGKLRYANYRVSKSAWLSPSDYGFVRKMAKRSEAITGLNMRSAEQLQIANYGIGGHYEPHFDHAREDEDKFTDLGLGNRIATMLFYISDVEAGGATVFTVGKTAVFPKKGTAVFWYNLKRNGIGNPITRHAACPVLVGQKWVSNWWIHEVGQEFRRKCALNKNL